MFAFFASLLVGFIKLQFLFNCWDENQHLWVRDHNLQPEKGGVPSPGHFVEEFKYLGLLFMSERWNRTKLESFNKVNKKSDSFVFLFICPSVCYFACCFLVYGGSPTDRSNFFFFFLVRRIPPAFPVWTRAAALWTNWRFILWHGHLFCFVLFCFFWHLFATRGKLHLVTKQHGYSVGEKGLSLTFTLRGNIRGNRAAPKGHMGASGVHFIRLRSYIV